MPSVRRPPAIPDDPPPGAFVQKAQGVAGELAPLREMPNIWFKVRTWTKPTYEAAKNAADNFTSNVRNGKYAGVPADAYEHAMAIDEPSNPEDTNYTSTVWLRYTGTP